MKKTSNFLRSEAYRKTFLSYLLIALLFSVTILSFIYRDIYKTGRENLLNEAAEVAESIDHKAEALVKSVDQFASRLYANSALSEDFFRFFGATAEEYTCRRLDLPRTPDVSIVAELKNLVIQTDFAIRHFIFYSPDRIVDLEYNARGNSRHRIIKPQQAEAICRSGCVYQKDIHENSAYIGKIAVVMDPEQFIDRKILNAPGKGFCLVLPGLILPEGQVKLSIPQARKILEGDNFPKRFQDENLSLFCAIHTSQILPMKTVFLQQADTLLRGLYINFIILLLCFAAAFSAITALLVWRFSRDTRCMQTILQSMDQARQEHFDPIPESGFNPEYDAIIRGLNKLYANLENLIHQEYKLTISQQKAEMERLSSQLNPHFLYNTLERIRMRAVIDNAPDVAEATAGLGLLYRNIVKTSPVIPMSREAAITEQYLDLMTFLYGDEFMYYIDLDPELENMETPKIWMQPIVENFFKHNFAQDDQIKVVVVEMKATKQGFEGRFFDNIGNLEPEKLAQINRELQKENTGGQGIGLQNVLYRLRLYYGPGLNITMENNDPAGICIHIVYNREWENDVSASDR